MITPSWLDIMDKNEKKLREDFEKILANQRIQNLLRSNLKSFPLAYYFMNQFISLSIYNDSKTQLQKNNNFKKIKYIIEKSTLCIKNAICKSPLNKKEIDILFLSRNRFFKIKTPTGDEIKSDYLFGNLIHKIKKNHSSYKMLFLSTTFYSVPSISDVKLYSLVNYSNPFILIESIILTVIIYVKWIFSKNRINNYLIDTPYQNFTQYFNSFFRFGNIFHYVFYDLCLQNALLKIKPKLIVANDDVMPLKPRCSFKNIKMVVMQSASMVEINEVFRSIFTSNIELEELIPDYFFAVGYKYKKMKEKFLAPSKILITGQPRYDILHYAKEIYAKDEFLVKNNIEKNKKIVLWTTQCHVMTIDENINNLETICKAVKDLNLVLMIKQHPAEGENYTELIKEYLTKYNVKALLAAKTSDTYQQIYVCDLLITKNSTTALEAIAMNKPVIILNLSSEPDILDYVTEGVAKGVYAKEDLKPSIEKLILDDSEFAKKREEFIKQHLYKIDGRSTERVLRIISYMLSDYNQAL